MSRTLAIALGLTVAYTGLATAQEAGPSFSCLNVKQPWAVAICSDQELARVEYGIAQSYQQLRDSLTGPIQLSFIDGQLNWLAFTKQKCGVPDGTTLSFGNVPPVAIGCLKSALTDRAAGLSTNNWQDLRAAFESSLDLNARAKFQQQLVAEGLYDGKPDGRFGPNMRRAIQASEKRHGLKQTAFVSSQLLTALGLSDIIPTGQQANTAPLTYQQAAAPALAASTGQQNNQQGSLRDYAGDWCTANDQNLTIKGNTLTFHNGKPSLIKLDGGNLFILGTESVFFIMKDANTLQQMFDDVEGDQWIRCAVLEASRSNSASTSVGQPSNVPPPQPTVTGGSACRSPNGAIVPLDTAACQSIGGQMVSTPTAIAPQQGGIQLVAPQPSYQQPTTPTGGPPPLMTAIQQTIVTFYDKYKTCSNQAQCTDLRFQRAEAFSRMGSTSIQNWPGKVYSLKTTDRGTLDIEIEITKSLYLQNCLWLTDSSVDSVIKRGDPIFRKAMNLSDGAEVIVSAQIRIPRNEEYKNRDFFAVEQDNERSAMQYPEICVEFTDIVAK